MHLYSYIRGWAYFWRNFGLRYLNKGKKFIFVNSVLWEQYVAKAEMVFKNGILPQIIGKYFTRVPKYTVYDRNDSLWEK